MLLYGDISHVRGWLHSDPCFSMVISRFVLFVHVDSLNESVVCVCERERVEML